MIVELSDRHRVINGRDCWLIAGRWMYKYAYQYLNKAAWKYQWTIGWREV